MKLHHESSHQFTNSEMLNKYIMGGRAVVTLESPQGKKHTYVYAIPRNSDSFPPDIRFVYALHDGVKEFYIGMIEMGRFRLTRNSRFHPDTEIVKGAKYIEDLRTSQVFLDKSPMKIYHEGICARCGRKLTDPKSIERGFGSKCRKKMGSETSCL